ncbi:enoyl-CoA hydratase-related protein [Amycolatopsis sp. H20-H5]|uniref:enoyl-CoA hydratase-related protein n=1 Tax=Amycolatopsis sp. H20-H5 TaxID=3046309 RepID=UPI002DBCAEED|nr:enoyl-CoA hydratase-related protein [Amycolatopsis sp. H20-H5]MEC3979939.1 enoyl-CoA hydratase-related protein [Amycolatopsis sp. H20-H5]
MTTTRSVTFERHPDTYRHWRLRLDGEVAWLELDVDENGGLVDGYELKLNSYDLGVDIELYDATQRLRFEHPEVRAVVVTSAKDKIFCAGANIRMLAASSHHWKVNFCKFTNETRNGMEDATEHSGQTYLAAINGTCAGGGYEIALACEKILLVDDNSSTVALPEVPLLGVLPGTGGLTRVVDKRRVRRDLADVFATRSDGVKGKTAVDWRLVDELVPRQGFLDTVRARASDAAQRSTRLPGKTGVELTPLNCEVTEDGLKYRHIEAEPGDLHEEGADGWLLALTRELDDAILRLRTNEPELGTWVLRSEGDPAKVLAHEQAVLGAKDWLSTEILHYFKRTLKRLDVTSRSLFALIEPGGCFAGLLLELALAADRQYILDGPAVATLDPASRSSADDEDSEERASITLSEANFGAFPMGNGLSRLESRFYADADHLARLARERDRPLSAAEANELGLVTDAPDDLDWADEIRIVLESRASLSPDALSGMEANHRFVGPETIETKIFGRLAAWQNWIFTRENASGPEGALRRYGTGQKAVFDRKRV